MQYSDGDHIATSGGPNWRRWSMRQIGKRVLPAVAALSMLATALPATVPAVEAAPEAGHVDHLLRNKAAEHPNGMVHVLIQRQKQTDAQGAVARHGGTEGKHLKVGNTIAAEVPARELDNLAKEPGVVRISYDTPVQVKGIAPSRLKEYFDQAVGASNVWLNYTGSNRVNYGNVQGTGIGVAILDSGISHHPDFNANCTGGGSRAGTVVPIDPDSQGGASDENGHGTFVAGILGGRGCGDPKSTADDSYYTGVAPSANVISVKVADQHGMSYVSNVIQGIEWVAQNKDAYHIRVMNMSIGESDPESYTTSYLDAAVELAWLQGITVVVAAGNNGPGAEFTAPANDPYVITVGATDDMGTAATTDDQIAWFSQYGTTGDGFAKPDLVAPGRHLIGPLSSPGAPLASAGPVLDNGYYIQLSGTSMSTPVVSGVVADLLQVRSTLVPDQIKWLLTKTAKALPFAGAGAGYPNLPKAITYGSTIQLANQGLLPNVYVQRAAAAALGWDTSGWDQVSWDHVSWDHVSWDHVSWDHVSWDNVSWDAVVSGD